MYKCLYTYSWSLKNMGLNCAGSLIQLSFSINTYYSTTLSAADWIAECGTSDMDSLGFFFLLLSVILFFRRRWELYSDFWMPRRLAPEPSNCSRVNYIYIYIYIYTHIVAVVQLFSCSVVSDSLWPCGLQHTTLLCPPTISWSLLKFTSTESVMLSTHLILCCPLLLLPSKCIYARG